MDSIEAHTATSFPAAEERAAEEERAEAEGDDEGVGPPLLLLRSRSARAAQTELHACSRSSSANREEGEGRQK